MTDAALSPPRASAAANPWLVAAVVVVPTFMEVLDTTIAVVALRYIAGGLSATVDDGEWVLTSYLAANAIILPITGWLSAHLGRRNYFLMSIAFSRSVPHCVEWPAVSVSSSCSASFRVWRVAVCSPAVRPCCWTPFRAKSRAWR
jgi:MFS family permease